jgi:outer membrane protein assembly factor BamE (lipoprotein component of BamABCDE complex)
LPFHRISRRARLPGRPCAHIEAGAFGCNPDAFTGLAASERTEIMVASLGRGSIVPLALVTMLALAGCTRVRDHKGYIVDNTLVDSVAAGIDNRDSVNKTLGRPSFASEWDNGATWYYIARDTRQLAFATPQPVSQMLLTVRFSPGGDVASVQRTGLETIRHVNLYGKRTAVRGSDRGFFAELFGNINAAGGSQQGPTADNPGGGR